MSPVILQMTKLKYKELDYPLLNLQELRDLDMGGLISLVLNCVIQIHFGSLVFWNHS